MAQVKNERNWSFFPFNFPRLPSVTVSKDKQNEGEGNINIQATLVCILDGLQY